ncbi:MAG: biosynthetic-type acetolactate synthase large subunit [Desulfobacterales bacterium]|nr:biosynthetic-type acetolactate synthase large subunit [Desulfobacterales bacterium]MCP4158435.1 biosynthetic-type acetolactate synthase large subunit [Deltaproteobacteria bacterium]
MELTGAEIIMKVLKEEEVDAIFGYPGGAVLDIYDALAKTDLRHFFVRHEQGAVHAADSYARATQKVGVALVTSGPGATNAVTGIASANSDSIPMVVITGQVSSALIGNDAFQEVDIVGITRPCTKHNYLVKDIKKLAKTLREAFHIARTGRPGPVLVDIPKDVTIAKTEWVERDLLKMRSFNPTYKPNKKQLCKVIDLIKEAKKPVIFAGGGAIISGASEELTKFAQATNIPVTGSLMGLGSFPGTDPLWLGMLGMHGTYRANMAISECDLLIAIGVRFDDRVTGKTDEFAQNAQVVQIDIDPTSIQKNVPVKIPVVGDCNLALQYLNVKIDEEEDKASLNGINKDEWLQKISDWKSTTPLKYDHNGQIKPQYVIEKLHEFTDGDAIITTEVGQNQMWAAQYYHFNKPHHFITSGGLGVMGFGLPAAIGAQVGCPDKMVVDIAGDGSIQMNIQEMATAVQYGLPVKIVILNNRYLGMVRQWQELFYDGVYSSTTLDHNPDFVKLAEAYGAKGLRAETTDQVEAVLKEGLETKGPVIMEFVVEREENVYPMVPAGKAITQMLLV